MLTGYCFFFTMLQISLLTLIFGAILLFNFIRCEESWLVNFASLLSADGTQHFL